MDQNVFNPTRKAFIHNGRTIYEWDQTLDEVNIYIQLPEGVKAKFIDCKITNTDLTVGIKGNPPYINEAFFLPVKNKDSFWTVEDGELHITLSKLSKGETWLGALKGHQQLNPMEEEKAKKQLMLERFQEENPGFDFSGAEFSGQAPDPKTFMNGIA